MYKVYSDEFYSCSELSPYLSHHGIKGMKWGVRHDKDEIKNQKKKIKGIDKERNYDEYLYESAKLSAMKKSGSDKQKDAFIKSYFNNMNDDEKGKEDYQKKRKELVDKFGEEKVKRAEKATNASAIAKAVGMATAATILFATAEVLDYTLTGSIFVAIPY